MRAAKWIAALLVGAALPAALVAFALADAWALLPAGAIALGHAVILGLPAALVSRRLKRLTPAFTLAGGFVIGAVPLGIFFWPLDPRAGSNSWSDATQTLVDGVPTWAGWVEYLQMMGGFGCLGAVGAIVFWLTLKVTGEFRPQ